MHCAFPMPHHRTGEKAQLDCSNSLVWAPEPFPSRVFKINSLSQLEEHVAETASHGSHFREHQGWVLQGEALPP